jgi:hypothetical protein
MSKASDAVVPQYLYWIKWEIIRAARLVDIARVDFVIPITYDA